MLLSSSGLYVLRRIRVASYGTLHNDLSSPQSHPETFAKPSSSVDDSETGSTDDNTSNSRVNIDPPPLLDLSNDNRMTRNIFQDDDEAILK